MSELGNRPGWYPDPENPDLERLWNGRVFTSDSRRSPNAKDEVMLVEETVSEEVWASPEVAAPVLVVEETAVVSVTVDVEFTHGGESIVLAVNPDADPAPWLTEQVSPVEADVLFVPPAPE